MHSCCNSVENKCLELSPKEETVASAVLQQAPAAAGTTQPAHTKYAKCPRLILLPTMHSLSRIFCLFLRLKTVSIQGRSFSLGLSNFLPQLLPSILLCKKTLNRFPAVPIPTLNSLPSCSRATGQEHSAKEAALGDTIQIFRFLRKSVPC